MYLPDHGANPKALYEKLGLQVPKQIFDLSENVNALGQPPGLEEVWQQFFDNVGAYPNMYAEPLRSEIAKELGVNVSSVVVTNGAAEGLMAIAQHVRGREAIVLEPSFSEYKRTLMQHGVGVKSVVVDDICSYQLPWSRLEQVVDERSVLYICNPNNPTGVCQTKDDMLRLVALTKERQALLVVDEAFIDFTDESSSIVDIVADNEHVIILRSMTKMYGLAGVRLGYAVTKQAPQLAAYLPHWNVSGIAIAVGIYCLQQHDFVRKSRAYSDEKRQELRRFLISHGCQVTNSAANFLTLRPPFETSAFYRYLLECGVVTRHSENFVGLDGAWLRIGMKNGEALDELMERWRAYEDDSFYSPRTDGME